MNRRHLAEFVEKLGRKKAAQRLKISERTLASWLSRGVPASKDAAATSTIERHRAAVERSTAAARWRDREWRERVRIPEKQRKRERLADEQRQPRRDPMRDPRARRGSVRKGSRGRDQLLSARGWEKTRITNWDLLTSPFQSVEQAYREEFLPNIAAWSERVVQLWRQVDPSGTPKETVVWVNVHLLRYYPDNPAYRGKPDLQSKAGHWVPMRTLSRGPVNTEHEAARLLEFVFFTPNKLDAGTSSERYISSIDEDADSRNFWVLGFFAVVGSRRPELSLAELTGGTGRPGDITPVPGRARRRRKR